MIQGLTARGTQTLTKKNSPVRMYKGIRHVKYYQLTSSEMAALGTARWLSSFAIGAAGAVLAFIFGVKWDAVFASEPTEAQHRLVNAVVQLSWGVFTALLAVGLLASLWQMRSGSQIRKAHTFFEDDDR